MCDVLMRMRTSHNAAAARGHDAADDWARERPFATRWRSPFRHARHPGRVPDSDRPPFLGGRFHSRRFLARLIESSGFFWPALPSPCRPGPRPERDPPTRTRCRIPLLEPRSDCVGVPSLSRESLSLSGVAQVEKRRPSAVLFHRFFCLFFSIFSLLFAPYSLSFPSVGARGFLAACCRSEPALDASHGHRIARAAARVSRASAQARVGFCRGVVGRLRGPQGITGGW